MAILTIAAGILLAVAALAFLAGLGFVGCAMAAILTAEKPFPPMEEE